MQGKRGLSQVIGAVVVFRAWSAAAQVSMSDNVIKIGVLNDRSGSTPTFRGRLGHRRTNGGRGLRRGGEGNESRDRLGADHQNKPDVGSNIARQWLDVDKVDIIVDVPNSG